MKKRLSPSEAKQKICRYCAYQERSHREVRSKLYEYGLYKSDVEDLLSQLIEEGFLNEARYAKAFAGGKFRMKHWGKIKIVHALEAQGVSKNCIQSGLKEIITEDYTNTLLRLLKKKLALLAEEEPFSKQTKAGKYAIQKGFEPDLVWAQLKDIC